MIRGQLIADGVMPDALPFIPLLSITHGISCFVCA